MWDLVGNPEDRFSHNEAHIVSALLHEEIDRANHLHLALMVDHIAEVTPFEPRREKTNVLVSDPV